MRNRAPHEPLKTAPMRLIRESAGTLEPLRVCPARGEQLDVPGEVTGCEPAEALAKNPPLRLREHNMLPLDLEDDRRHRVHFYFSGRASARLYRGRVAGVAVSVVV